MISFIRLSCSRQATSAIAAVHVVPSDPKDKIKILFLVLIIFREEKIQFNLMHTDSVGRLYCTKSPSREGLLILKISVQNPGFSQAETPTTDTIGKYATK